jgi:hypothetical protein
MHAGSRGVRAPHRDVHYTHSVIRRRGMCTIRTRVYTGAGCALCALSHMPARDANARTEERASGGFIRGFRSRFRFRFRLRRRYLLEGVACVQNNIVLGGTLRAYSHEPSPATAPLSVRTQATTRTARRTPPGWSPLRT